MEPAGAERHGRSPEGVSERERANQSNRAEKKGRFRNKTALKKRRGREWSRREPSDIDEAPKG
jgi:hypothetical protein